ncbi:TlpA family protein disulfide reductase [Algoriphagus zhangzhouensis]|uniref:Thiol-disulfide isomerase or thioredoxin n=1 Tax=Algoriphagus zhangzhouensis TaxID=1073327 RepID=A0A1M7Z735_9BACT|nr:TlpA disulfide reductase family protein [Algoriphagus zhangzhouensis]TDY49309.1 thiol-disulfide isomerase/thioredoxin [Algoriphagus zhangzhouensis]SHO60748.1 Thiol-disulfide isomerase or thioredoxin [Algoriphagus zhangzhouensis]
MNRETIFKELKSWGLILSFFAFLYFTGLLPVVQGAIQSVLLSTGLIKPKIERVDLTNNDFDYRGQFMGFDGNRIDLKDYKGKTLFINLWASWCGPCRAEMPHISELYKSLEGEDNIDFLMIGLDNDIEKSRKMLDGKSWTFPTAHASFGLNEDLQSESIPTTLVVNPEGKIVFYQEGMSNFNTKEFRDFLIGL